MYTDSAGVSYLKVASQIIGGVAAAQTQFPWQIYVYMDNSWLCGGSLIAANWVLTAGHCVKGYINIKLRISIHTFLFTACLPLW
jgi:secreted trypsin-like serine protease